jgi:hypothetical protein
MVYKDEFERIWKEIFMAEWKYYLGTQSSLPLPMFGLMIAVLLHQN